MLENLNLCANAKSIDCQDFIEISLASASSEQYGNICSQENEPDIWLSIEGDDMIHVIQSVNHVNQYFEIDIYEGSCEDRFDNCPIDILEFDFNDSIQTFLASAGNNYLLRVMSRFNDIDTVQLNHFCMLPATNDLCENAEVVDCGQSLIGNTTFATSSNGYNGCTFEDSNDVWFAITGDDMVHELFADSIQNFSFNAIDIFEEDCSLEYTLCRTSIFNYITKTVSLFAEAGKTYNIRVSDTDGYFEFSHSCRLPLVNDNCTDAIDISCGQTIEGDTELATYTGISNGCYSESDNDLWYTIEGDDQLYNFTPDISEQNDFWIEIYEEACTNMYSICNNRFNLSPGETDFFFAAAGTTYYLRLFTSSFFDDSSFRFSIDCLEPIVNDNCTNAIDISCGDSIEGNTELATPSNTFNGCTFENSPDLWYTIDGDDVNYIITASSLEQESLVIDIYQESCDAPFTICSQNLFLAEGDFDVFLAEAGNTYYLRIYSSFSFVDFVSESFEISIECIEPLANDRCENPETLLCGQTFESDLFFANAEPTQFPCSFSGQEDDVWFEIIGDDMVHMFEVDIIEFGSLGLEIIEGTCETNNGECYETGSLNQDYPYSFYAETGKNYLIRLYRNCCFGDSELFFRVSHECVPLADNDSCDSALLWECGSPIIGSTDLATFTDSVEGCNFNNSPDLWYLILGDGLVHSISVLNNDVDNVIHIYRQSCDEEFSICEVEFNTFNGGGGYNFYAEIGDNYLVQVSMSNCCSSSTEFNLLQECFSPVANDFCANAIDISCNNTIGVEASNASPSTMEMCFSDQNENDIWFGLEGDDLIHVFESNDPNVVVRIQIFDVDCPIDQSECPVFTLYTDSNGNSFFAEIGTSYLMRMFAEDRDADISLDHICLEPAENGMCETAEQNTCGETIIGNTQAAPRSSYSCNSIAVSDRALWYEFVGDGMIHQFQFGPEVVDPLDLVLITGQCEDSFNADCQRIFLNSNNEAELSILFEENVIYYLRIGFRSDDGSFTLFHNCIEPAINNLCETAIPISCNNVITGDTNIATDDPNMGACSYNSASDLWYSIEGDGMIHNFSIGSSESECISVDIYESCTDEIENCLSSDLRDEDDNLRFLADIGTTYLVRVTTCFTQSLFELEHSCADVSSNDLCENAIEISCGETLIGNTDFAFPNNEFNGCNFEGTNDVWYTITGDDKTHVFSSQLDIYNLNVDLYEGSCSLNFTECETENHINESQSFSFFAEAGTLYTIRVYYDSFNGSGPYSIHYQCEDPPANDVCTNAIEIDCNTSQINGDLTFANFNEQAGLCTINNEVKDIWYSITGDDLLHAFFYFDGGAFSIEIYENFCEEDNFFCTGQFFTLFQEGDPGRFIAELNKTYLIRVYRANNLPLNSFSFLHMCMEPTENDNCADATAINCDESFSGDFSFSTSEGYISGCFNEEGNDLWYSIEGDGQRHLFTLKESESSFLEFEIFTNDCNFPRECIISESIRVGQAEDFIFETGTDYLIRLSNSRFRIDGSFEFNHECFPIAENDECENAIFLTCGDIIEGDTNSATLNEDTDQCFYSSHPDLWYSISGDGMLHSFDLISPQSDLIAISVYEENCEAICVFNSTDPRVTFQTTANTNYLINIALCCGSESAFSIEYSCHPAVANDNCENAIPISCGDSLQGSFQNSTSSGLRSDCLFETQQDVWYSLTGDGSAHIFTNLESELSFYIDVFESTCSQRFDACPVPLFSTNEDFNRKFFVSENDVEYLIRVIKGNRESTFHYDYSCENPESDIIMPFFPQNDTCLDAIEFSCGETINIDLSNATIDSDRQICGNVIIHNGPKGLWYTFTGDGAIWELNSSQTEINPTIFLYEDDCSNTICLDSNIGSFSRSLTVDTEVGTNYYVLVSSGIISEPEVIIEVNCFDPPSNDFCDTPTAIVCGEEYLIELNNANPTNEFGACTIDNNKDVWFSFTGTGEFLSFEIDAQSFQSTKLVFYEGDCSNIDNCNGSHFFLNATNKSRSFLTTQGVNYLIRFAEDSSNSQRGTLRFDCFPPSVNDLCINAEEITCDSLILGNLMTATFSDRNNGCTIENTNDLWYTLIGDGQVHSFTTNNILNEFFMQFYEESCSNDPLDCQQYLRIDASQTTNTFIFQDGVRYYIRLFERGQMNIGEFILNHSCGEPITNNTCHDAIQLGCQDTIIQDIQFSTFSILDNTNCLNNEKDIWYTIEGNNNYYQIDLLYFSFGNQFHRIFTGDCTSGLDCLYDFRLNDDEESYVFFAEAGVTYYLSTSATADFGNNILFTTSCLEPSVNDQCTDASALNCGELVSGNTTTATADPVFTGCDFNGENDVWYTITGDDLFHSFEYISSEAFGLLISIYEGDCDNYFINCLVDFNLNEFTPSNSFFAESGQDYLIKITTSEPGNFSFLYNCLSPAVNDFCEQAINIDCNETVSVNLLNSTYTPLYSDCQTTRSGDIWYQIIGDNQIKTLSLDSLFDANAVIEIYTQDCTNKYNCLNQFEYEGNVINQGFFAEEGLIYYLRIYSRRDFWVPTLNLTLQCSDAPTNIACDTAAPLNCGVHMIGSTIGLQASDEIITPCFTGFADAPVIWYSFTGDNQLTTLTIESTDVVPYASLYNRNCEDQDCAQITFLSFNQFSRIYSLTFRAERDSVYYLLVSSHSTEDPGEFTISVDCEPIPDNDFVQSAQLVTCGEQTDGSIFNARPNELQVDCIPESLSTNGVWYAYESTGDSLELIFSELGFIPTVSLHEVVDSNFICVEQKTALTQANSINTCQSSTIPSLSIPCISTSLDTFCIPIFAENIEDLIELSVNVSYDTPLRLLSTNSNYSGFTQVGFGIANQEINIRWQNTTDNPSAIDESVPYFIEICFSSNSDSAIERIEFDFTGESRFIRPFGFSGTISTMEGCLDSGVAFDPSSQQSCDRDVSLVFDTEPEKSYFIFVSGTNEFDSGDFSFTTNCPGVPEEVTEIPTLGEWGLICLSLLLAIFGIVGIKQETMDQAVE
jgi:hypothetical protein